MGFQEIYSAIHIECRQRSKQFFALPSFFVSVNAPRVIGQLMLLTLNAIRSLLAQFKFEQSASFSNSVNLLLPSLCNSIFFQKKNRETTPYIHSTLYPCRIQIDNVEI